MVIDEADLDRAVEALDEAMLNAEALSATARRVSRAAESAHGRYSPIKARICS